MNPKRKTKKMYTMYTTTEQCEDVKLGIETTMMVTMMNKSTPDTAKTVTAMTPVDTTKMTMKRKKMTEATVNMKTEYKEKNEEEE